MIKRFILPLLLICILGFNINVSAQTVIRISYNAPTTQDSLVVQWEQEHGMAAIFKSIVETRTGGDVIVELYPDSQLGGHLASVEMVQGGTIQAAVGTGIMAGFFPEFELISIPYLFKSEEIAWYLFDNSEFWANLMEKMAEETGIRLLGMGQNGTRHFTHKSKFIKSPEDLKGEKIRVMQSPVFIEMMRSFGAEAVPIAWTELYTSLQTGVVAGQENPVSVIVSGSIYEVQKYITLDGHLWSEDVFVINNDFYNSLSDDVKGIIQSAIRQAVVVNRGVETIHANGPGLEKLIAEGMEVYVPTIEEKNRFAEVAQPAVLTYLREKIGD